MELAQVLVLNLSLLTILGTVAGKSLAKNQKKWRLFGMQRIRRDLENPHSAQLTDVTLGSHLIKPEDLKDPWIPSSSDSAHIRVKRYRHNLNHFGNLKSMTVGCRFGTCTVQNLAHQIFQYTDKDKDSTAPAKKISSQGYGRRRRSVPDRKLLLDLVDGKLRPSWVSTTQKREPTTEEPLSDLGQASRAGQAMGAWERGTMWQALLRT
ncbi:pro-adrenomedullin [Pelodytes ibericus]